MPRRNENIYKESAENWKDGNDRFSNIAKEWLTLHKPQWKQSSVVKYTNILNAYLFPCFADRRVTEITRNEIVSFSSKLLVDGGKNKNGLSPKTVMSILSVMKNIFEYTVQIKGYSVADIKGISVKQSQKPMRILSRTEQMKLSKYLCDHLNYCNLGILVCLYTGLRIGEICALKWADVFFDEQYLYVHQTMQRLQTSEGGKARTMIVISTPKSDCSIRRVPIPDDIFLLLKEARRQENAFFLTGIAHDYIEPRTMQNHFKTYQANNSPARKSIAT